jgi:TIR domain
MTKVFISYHSQDQGWVEQMKAHLSSKEVEVWADVDINPGENWEDEVKNAINTSNFAIILVSDDYQKSKLIDNELLPISENEAQGRIQMLPVLVSQVKDLVPLFENHKVFKCLDPKEKEITYRNLTARIKQSTDNQPKHEISKGSGQIRGKSKQAS